MYPHDGSTLPALRSGNLNPVPGGADPLKYVDADAFNRVLEVLDDLGKGLTQGPMLGLVHNATAALSASNRVHLRSNSGNLEASENGQAYDRVRSAEWVNAASRKFAGGVRANGTTDDTAAVQAAIDASHNWHHVGNMYGRSLILPGGDIRITDTLEISGVLGWNLLGEGRFGGTKLIWDGPDGIPMLRINSSQHTKVQDLTFWGTADSPPSECILYDYNPVAVAAYANVIRDVYMTGQASLGCFDFGVRFSGGYGNNSEFTAWGLICEKFREAAYKLQGSQQKCHLLYGCNFNGSWDGNDPDANGGKYGVQCVEGSYLFLGGGVGSCRQAAFTQPAPNDPILIEHVQSENCYRFFDGGTVKSSGPHNVAIRNSRLDTLSVIDDDPETAGYIRYSGAGSFVFEGNTLYNDKARGGIAKIRLSYGGTMCQARIEHNHFGTYGSANESPVIDGSVFWPGSYSLRKNTYMGLDGQPRERDETLNNGTFDYNLRLDIHDWQRHGPSRYVIGANGFTAAAASESRQLCLLPQGTRLRGLRFYNYNAWGAPGSVKLRLGTTEGGQELLLDQEVGGINSQRFFDGPECLGPALAYAPLGGHVHDFFVAVPIWVTVTRDSGNLGDGDTTAFTDGYGFVYLDLEVLPRYVPGA